MLSQGGYWGTGTTSEPAGSPRRSPTHVQPWRRISPATAATTNGSLDWHGNLVLGVGLRYMQAWLWGFRHS